MFSKKLLFPSLFLFMTLLLMSCAAPKELEYRDFKNLTIEKVGFSASAIKMDLVYYNPNNFGLQLQRTDLDIFIDNNYLGHTVQDLQITIPKRQEFFIPIRIEVDMKNLLKNSFVSLLNSEILVKATGTIKVGKANVYKTFPVSYEGRQRFSMF